MPFNGSQFAIVVSVLRPADGEFTNGGLTSKHTHVLLVGPGGPPDGFDTKKAGLPVFHVVRRTIGGEPYHSAEPDEEFRPTKIGGEPVIGPMAGGNFLYSTDSRFRRMFPYPIPAHDRFESVSQYNALSM